MERCSLADEALLCPCSFRVPETLPISMCVACHVQSRDAPMKFTQQDIQYFRVKILNEILELRVE